MLVNWQKGYVFVHVPKTGGTSITQVLKHDCDRAILPLRALGYLFDHAGHRLPERAFPWVGYPYHIRARDLLRLWGERYRQLSSFAFVRNPWDLVVSEYAYIQHKWDHPSRREVSSLGSFEAFVRWKQANGHHANQLDWLTDDDGSLIVSHIGRFEAYGVDAQAMLTRVGCNEPLPHANASARGDYRSAYTQETRAMIAAMYERDIEAFGYAF